MPILRVNNVVQGFIPAGDWMQFTNSFQDQTPRKTGCKVPGIISFKGDDFKPGLYHVRGQKTLNRKDAKVAKEIHYTGLETKKVKT